MSDMEDRTIWPTTRWDRMRRANDARQDEVPMLYGSWSALVDSLFGGLCRARDVKPTITWHWIRPKEKDPLLWEGED